MPKEHHRKRHFRLGKWLSLAGKIAGAAVMLYPTIQGVVDVLPGGTAAGAGIGAAPQAILYRNTGYYSGYNGGTPNTWSIEQAGTAVASFAGGFIIIKLFSWLGKRI